MVISLPINLDCKSRAKVFNKHNLTFFFLFKQNEQINLVFDSAHIWYSDNNLYGKDRIFFLFSEYVIKVISKRFLHTYMQVHQTAINWNAP